MNFVLPFIFLIYLFFAGFSTDLLASRPAAKSSVYAKTIALDSVSLTIRKNITKKIAPTTIYLSDSIPSETEPLPEKPKKTGLGMIIWGGLFTLLGFVFGIGLLLTFLLGFSIGSGFYFRDIYATAGVMLGGLVVFGVGIYMISRGREHWRAYKRYRKALKKMRKNTTEKP